MNKKLHKVTIEVIGYTLTTSEMEAAMQAGAMIDDVYIADYAYATEVREGDPIEGEWAVFDRVYGTQSLQRYVRDELSRFLPNPQSYAPLCRSCHGLGPREQIQPLPVSTSFPLRNLAGKTLRPDYVPSLHSL